jgi:hypothetical protein
MTVPPRLIPDHTDFHEYRVFTNQYGNLWVYGRVAGTSETGWQYIGNLTRVSGSGIADVYRTP